MTDPLATFSIDLDAEIDDFLAGYRPGSQAGYGYFLRSFLPVLCRKLKVNDLADIRIRDAENIFEAYSGQMGHKPSTVRSHRYALKAFLRFEGAAIAENELTSDPWEGRMNLIDEAAFREFLDTIRGREEPERAADLCLIACLAYYTGLSLNEILRLTRGGFYRTPEGYRVNVTAVSRKEKTRTVPVPADMEKELTEVLSRGSGSLFSLTNGEVTAENSGAGKRKIQRCIEAAGKSVNATRIPPLRIDLKSFRTYRICAELHSGRPRKEIKDLYGVTNYYLSHLAAMMGKE